MSAFQPYSPPFFLFNAHLETIYPAILRRVNLVPYQRERIHTSDNDFLDLDWLIHPSKKLVIISHGLEGNSHRPYIRGMVKALFSNGYDTLAWNYRGCSEEINRQLRFYHSGATDDLNIVVQHAVSKHQYEEIYLVGFSLGGNMTLKYLGERAPNPQIKKAIVFSVPLDLKSSCEKISLPGNYIYSRRFVNSLKTKILRKSLVMQGLDTSHLDKIKTLQEFDEAYTAPLHGFDNAIKYYDACSSIHFLNSIATPTLLINTQNDPFLSKQCFPQEQLKNHSFVSFEFPLRGGHVGFAQINKNGLYWSELRALHWFDSK